MIVIINNIDNIVYKTDKTSIGERKLVAPL